jgi:hypothetical protein
MPNPLYGENLAAIWRKSAAQSLYFVTPQGKCKPAIRGWRSITASSRTPRSRVRCPPGISRMGSSAIASSVRLGRVPYSAP